MDDIQSIAAQVGARNAQVAAAIELLDAENTLPFIARYRKEVTGGLDEEQLRQVSELIARQRSLEQRRQAIVHSIEEQGQMTPELLAKLEAAQYLTALEDLYQPFRPKRRTRAGIARERGLQPLADLILQQARSSQPLAEIAAPFLSELVPDSDSAWAGARDIVAETVSDHPEVRRVTREKALQWGSLVSQKVEDAADDRLVYELYYDFEFVISRLRPHQVLAINRGETEKVLRVKVAVLERDWQSAVQAYFRPLPQSPFSGQLQEAILDAVDRLLLPAIERDVRRALTENAETHAIGVFASNLRALLSQPPLVGHVVLGIDPGFRTGSKVAVVDPTGKLLETTTIYPHAPQNHRQEALKKLGELVIRHHVTLIAIGNGTASRETESLAAELIRVLTQNSPSQPLHYLIVNEAGASVYSASPLARQEMPELDVSLRGAVSIARRSQDPLAELVKIDPRSIGIGLYQHDVDQKRLAESLTAVVESVVNGVGVDLNTASPSLLAYVAGIGPKLAERIVLYRDGNGRFVDRGQLKKVTGLGPKAFEQAAGFLRIRAGSNPLDASAIHPESYPAALALLKKANLSPDSSLQERKAELDKLTARVPLQLLAAELKTGIPTLRDILEQLVQPGRDPRQELPLPLLRSDVLSVEDLKPGMRLKGTVRNVVDFGAFVDIGVKQDGLLHRSQLPPGTILQVGDVIEVEILKVEAERGRIGLGWARPANLTG